MTSWLHISYLFEKVKNRFSGNLDEARIKEEIKKLAPQGEVVFFNKKTGELLLKVPNSIMAQSLYFRSYEIINKINRDLKKKLVSRIRFRVG